MTRHSSIVYNDRDLAETKKYETIYRIVFKSNFELKKNVLIFH